VNIEILPISIIYFLLKLAPKIMGVRLEELQDGLCQYLVTAAISTFASFQPALNFSLRSCLLSTYNKPWFYKFPGVDRFSATL